MRRTIRIIVIGIAVFILPLVCLSQKGFTDGYIFTNEMQRIEGQIQKQSDIANCRYVNFKEGESVTKYTPSRVKSWGFTGSQHFISENVKVGEFEEQVFLEYVIQARVSLLVFYGVGDDPRFFVRKEGDEIRELIYTVSIRNVDQMEIENKHFVGVLNILLSDCPDVSEDISSAHYKLNDLKKLLVKYNTCVAPDEIFFEKEVKDQSPVNIGLLIGYNVPNYSIYSTSNRQDMSISIGEDISKGYISYGINFSARVGKMEGFSFSLGILYEEYGIEIDMSDVSVYPGGNIYYSNISVSIPIQIRYAYSKYKIRPFAALGYTSRFFAKHQGNAYGFKTHHKGFNVGIGAEYQVFNFASLFFEFRYQIVKTSMADPPDKDVGPFDYMKLKTNSIVLLTGVNF